MFGSDLMKYAVIGGDERQLYLAERLAKQSETVYAYGITEKEISADIVFCDKLSCTLEDADAVILPIPTSTDGVNVFAPHFFEYIRLSEILAFRPKLICGGIINSKLRNMFELADVPYFDYYEDKELTEKNAKLTAEATIGTIHKTSKLALEDSSVLICGYGRIGKALSKYLLPIAGNLTVSARKENDLENIRKQEINAINTGNIQNYCNQYDIIINTIPALIFDENILRKCRSDINIIDLATGGGTDFNAARDMKINAVLASGLPGKILPVSAGWAVAESILRYMQKE